MPATHVTNHQLTQSLLDALYDSGWNAQLFPGTNRVFLVSPDRDRVLRGNLGECALHTADEHAASVNDLWCDGWRLTEVFDLTGGPDAARQISLRRAVMIVRGAA